MKWVKSFAAEYLDPWTMVFVAISASVEPWNGFGFCFWSVNPILFYVFEVWIRFGFVCWGVNPVRFFLLFKFLKISCSSCSCVFWIFGVLDLKLWKMKKRICFFRKRRRYSCCLLETVKNYDSLLIGCHF